MFLVKRLLFGYLIILYFNVQPSIQADDDQSKSSEKSVASGLSEDVGKLNETVTNVVEDYSESDSEDSGTPEEKREKRMKRKFEKVAEREFQKAQKVVDKQYSKFVKGTFESLDLVDFATEHLKRFWFTGQCRRNYELKCPKGWTETDGFCKAPLDYTGLCKDSVDFTDFGPREKEDFAWRCEAEWPCINEKPLFEGFECPFEWAPISDSLCLAPKTYEGMCPPILDVSKFDVRKKSLYERKCNVHGWQFYSGNVRWSRVSSKNLSQRLDKGQLRENTVSGIIDEGIIRLL